MGACPVPCEAICLPYTALMDHSLNRAGCDVHNSCCQSEGRAGKTTIATNLAGYLAGKHQRVVVLDDRQRLGTLAVAATTRVPPKRRVAGHRCQSHS